LFQKPAQPIHNHLTLSSVERFAVAEMMLKNYTRSTAMVLFNSTQQATHRWLQEERRFK